MTQSEFAASSLGSRTDKICSIQSTTISLDGTIVADYRRGNEKNMEYVTITARSEGHRYVAIYRKWFSESLGAWEFELVPGTLRWLD